MLPGVPRTTNEEKEFADFEIFDDVNHPYSTFNFKYTHKAFDRLTQLTEFNTLLCKDLIIQKIKECIVKKQNNPARKIIRLRDIKRLRLQKQSEDRLKLFVKSQDAAENIQEEEPVDIFGSLEEQSNAIGGDREHEHIHNNNHDTHL